MHVFDLKIEALLVLSAMSRDARVTKVVADHGSEFSGE